MLLIRGLLGVSAHVTGLAVFLFLPAGTWQWPRALIFIGGHAIVGFTGVIVLALYAPRSLEARMQGPIHASQPVRDRVITMAMAATLMTWVMFVSVDVNRLHLLPAPPLWLSAIGGVGSALGLTTIFTALYQNAYAAPIVKDQSERGQTLVSTGLYGRIRHPFYAGYLAYQFGMALWLGSSVGIVATMPLVALVVARIRIEEKTLCTLLIDYPDYIERVPYRVLPGFW